MDTRNEGARMRDYQSEYRRKLRDCLYWMNRAKAAEAKLKALREECKKLVADVDGGNAETAADSRWQGVHKLLDTRTKAQAIMGYPAISNMHTGKCRVCGGSFVESYEGARGDDLCDTCDK